MKGTLNRISDKWVVWYDEEPMGGNVTFVNGSLPLHPYDAQQYQEMYDFYGASGFVPTEVDFEIANGYAQLITPLSEERVGEYPELEGTVNLCSDIISERKYTKEDLIELVQTLTSTPSCISREAATHIVDYFIKSKQ